MMASEQLSPAASSTPAKKKYVTRACDSCKKRKSKCDGCEPCVRCINSEIACTYNMSYNRVQRRHLLLNRQEARQRATPASTVQAKRGSDPLPDQHPDAAPPSDGSENRGDDTGDPSVHEFLRRVSDHLAQIGQGLPRNLLKRDRDSLDEDSSSVQSFILPDRAIAAGYVECFFEHALVTYRYLNRNDIENLLDLVYAEDEATWQDHSTMAVMLLVMGIGCLWTASWKNYPLAPWRKKSYKFLQAAEARLDETRRLFPPTIRLVQAQVLKCQLELGSSRFNSAWLTLGLAVRLGQSIDLQREQPSATAIEAHYQRNLFWAMFVIDRYLAVALGRPMAIHESDITVSLSSELHPDVAAHLGRHETKLMTGVVAQARLARVLGHIITKLYPGSRRTAVPIDQAVTELEAEVQEWLRDTPSFFHPPQDRAGNKGQGQDSDFYDVPWIFRRQQRTVRAAFFFANMLIYRGCLLVEFLHQSPSTPRSSPSSQRVKACLENALAMATLAADLGVEECKYNAAFWNTSHFLFCAISILLVYLTLYQESDDRATIEAAIEDAMKVHRRLDCTTNVNTQRLLEESRTRAETVRQMVPPAPQQPPVSAAETQPQEISSDFGSSTAVELTQIAGEEPFSLDSRFLNDSTMDGTSLGPFGTTGDFDMIMDLGFDNTSFAFQGFGGEHDFSFEGA